MQQAPVVKVLTDNRKVYGLFLQADPDAKAHQQDLGNLYHHVGKPRQGAIGIERRRVPATSWYDYALKVRSIAHTERFERPPLKDGRAQRPKLVKGMVTVLGMDTGLPPSVQATKLAARADETTKIAGGWEGGKFSLTAFSTPMQALLKRIHKGFIDGKIAMWQGPLATGLIPPADGVKVPEHDMHGLFITFYDKIPESILTWLEGADRYQAILQERARTTAIEGRIRRAGERVSKLNPKLSKAFKQCRLEPHYLKDVPLSALSKERRAESKHKILFHLSNADPFATGYFTVEELERWLDGRGPVAEGALPSPKK